MVGRRKKNRKRDREESLFPRKLALFLGGGAIIFVSYLWLCGRCEDFGIQIKKLEDKKAEVHRQVLNEEYKWANMKTPQNIENYFKLHNMTMVWPDQEQIVRLRHYPGPMPDENRQYVAHTEVMND